MAAALNRAAAAASQRRHEPAAAVAAAERSKRDRRAFGGPLARSLEGRAVESNDDTMRTRARSSLAAQCDGGKRLFTFNSSFACLLRRQAEELESLAPPPPQFVSERRCSLTWSK